MSTISLNTYFERIGYEEAPTATLDTLRALHKKHTEAIPFENLNPLLGLPVKLSLKSLEQKMIHNQRGGYCFEQNLLFHNVLQQIGFEVRGLAARIRWNKSDDEITPRSHMLLLVKTDSGDYLADVGFGSQTLTGPISLEADITQKTPHEPRRLIQREQEFIMQTYVKNEWKSLYQFNLDEHYPADYKVSSWYLSNHPESHFVTGLIAARPGPGVRYTLNNHTFTVYHHNGEVEKKTLDTIEELKMVLERNFKLTLPKRGNLDKKFSSIINHN